MVRHHRRCLRYSKNAESWKYRDKEKGGLRVIKAAAETFSMVPAADAAGQKLTFGHVQKIFTPLKTTIILLQDDNQSICLLTSHWLGVHYYQFSNILRKTLSDALGVPFSHVLVFGSHNHCSAALTSQSRVFGQPMEKLFLSEDQLTTDGQQFVSETRRTAEKLRRNLRPVTVSWGEGRERRITHNNKGYRPDGRTYMIRHPERMQLGENFTGDIDDHAPVIALTDNRGYPAAFIVQFTGHPTTAYHPDYAVVHGEYPQIACDDLSAAYGNVPVAFIQGCAADSYSVESFAGKAVGEAVSRAESNGHLLGETYTATSRKLQNSQSSTLALAWDQVRLPFELLPSLEQMREQLDELDHFSARCQEGDDGALECVGLNFPASFSFEHRINLVEPVRQWVKWIIELHQAHGRLGIPEGVTTPVVSFCIGDVGFSGLACEPFMGIGRQIRSGSPFPITVPCGYVNDTSLVNIPDSQNNGDLDFMSSTYRYTKTMLPYKQPAGDLLAASAVSMLKRMV